MHMEQLRKLFQSLLSGSFLAKLISRHRYFLLLLLLLSVFFVGNTLRSQKKKAELSILRKKLENMRSQYIHELSDVMRIQTPSNVKNYVLQKQIGLNEASEPLFIINE